MRWTTVAVMGAAWLASCGARRDGDAVQEDASAMTSDAGADDEVAADAGDESISDEANGEGGAVACTTCHGMPPPSPHPQSARCSVCHGAVVGSDDRSIIDPARHFDGIIEVSIPDGCTSCHGGENAAPPLDVDGGSDTSLAGVGAHQAHVKGTPRSRAVPCSECHVVPNQVLDAGHIDSPSPAEVTFSGAAVAFATTPSYAGGACQNTACHGARGANQNVSGAAISSPIWTKVDGTQAACGDCHSLPPPAPHPAGPLVCAGCHHDIAEDLTFIHPERHVDGIITFSLPM